MEEPKNWPPISNGTKVHAVKKGKRDYSAEGDVKRGLLSGCVGEVISHSDSHGLCYQVKFEGGDMAWFDPDELT